MMVFGWLVLLLFLAVIIGGAVWFLQYLFPSIPSKNSPLDILDRRYASGEISGEEYEERRRLLSRE